MSKIAHSHTTLLVILFVLLTAWWIVLGFSGERETMHVYIFGASYGIIALLGGIWGFEISKQWGFTKSLMGKAIFFLSLGLLAAEFGQIVFSYYNIFLHEPVPYPSIADIGFFANIPLYSIAMYYIARVSGANLSIHKLSSRLLLVLLPMGLLLFSYFRFLQGYEFDWQNPLKVFLDFGYPLGQAFYVSLSLVAYLLSKDTLGGIMKSRILLLLLAFLTQYIADYNFLYQTSRGTWYNGGYGDYLYLIAYFLMAFGLLRLKTVLYHLRK